jgi:AcrR family transcriptional regulator
MAIDQTPAVPRRRDVQREDTRQALAAAAFELACARGLGEVRVPDIAAAAGVSTRTFNNYFPSKEAAVAWPAVRRAGRLAENLLARPVEEPLGEALAAAAGDMYSGSDEREDDPTAEWLGRFRALVAGEPALRGEYLKAAAAGEQALARAIAARTGAGEDELAPKVVAALVVGAERAAVMHWMNLEDKSQPLQATVLAAVQLALTEVR